MLKRGFYYSPPNKIMIKINFIIYLEQLKTIYLQKI